MVACSQVMVRVRRYGQAARYPAKVQPPTPITQHGGHGTPCPGFIIGFPTDTAFLSG